MQVLEHCASGYMERGGKGRREGGEREVEKKQKREREGEGGRERWETG